MKLYFRKPLTAIIATIIAFTTVSTASADETSTTPKDVFQIVAIGDSITVGYEPGMDLTSTPYGYDDRLLEQALYHGRADLSNYAIMGLTTPGLINLLQGAADGRKLTSSELQDFSSFDPSVAKQADGIAAKTDQLAADLSSADLVVLTIGGNDFGDFIKNIIKLSTQDARKAVEDEFDITMNNYTKSMDKMINNLHLLAPNAQIVFADQYLPLPKIHPLYDDLLAAVQKLANKLDVISEGLAKEGIPVQIAHVSQKFVGKESTYAHVAALEVKPDNHPTQAGYEVIAQAFADVVWKQYLKPSPKASEDKLSIIINGQELFSEAIVKNNTTFLALRDVSNAVKADLKWNQKQQTATFLKNGREVTITIGAKTMLVNGVSQPVDTPAYFQKVGKLQKTYVPLAVIIKGLDYNVVYRKKSQTIFINS
jgi:lysophospholipase L1-like esterase